MPQRGRQAFARTEAARGPCSNRCVPRKNKEQADAKIHLRIPPVVYDFLCAERDRLALGSVPRTILFLLARVRERRDKKP